MKEEHCRCPKYLQLNTVTNQYCTRLYKFGCRYNYKSNNIRIDSYRCVFKFALFVFYTQRNGVIELESNEYYLFSKKIQWLSSLSNVSSFKKHWDTVNSNTIFINFLLDWSCKCTCREGWQRTSNIICFMTSCLKKKNLFKFKLNTSRTRQEGEVECS